MKEAINWWENKEQDERDLERRFSRLWFWIQTMVGAKKVKRYD